MGGYGSGDWLRWDRKRKTQGSLPLDIRKLHHKGLLKSGCGFTYRWWRGLDPNQGSNIRVEVGTDKVMLRYRSRRGIDEWEPYEQQIALEWTPCNYGGVRPWWLCPTCGRRVVVLYSPFLLFECRQCCRLAYPSQNECPRDRALSLNYS